MGKKVIAKTKLKSHQKQGKSQQKSQKKEKSQSERNQVQHGQGVYIKTPENLMSKTAVDNLPPAEKAELIQEIANFIITEPEYYITHLQTLLYLMSADSPLITKLACFSLTEIFKDITPQYQINYTQHIERLKTQIKKEERTVLTFEAKLYENYEKFVSNLFVLLKAKAPQDKKDKKDKKKKKQNNPPAELTPIQKNFQALNQMSLKCLCELLTSLYHFNNVNDIASKIVFSYLSADSELQKIAFEKISEVLSDTNHSLYELKKHILKDLAKILKTRPEKDTPDEFLDLVNKIEIDTQYLPKDFDNEQKNKKLDAKKRKKQFYLDLERAKKDGKKFKTDKEEYVAGKKQRNMNEDDKHALKSMKKELKEELKEGVSELTPQQIVRHNADILEKIFYIYFKVIKSEEISKFFNSAMNGILKHVHLINVDLISALVENLYICGRALRGQTQKNKNLSNLEKRLACIFTIEDIIQGPGQAIDIDDKDAQQHFFHIIIDMNKFDKKVQVEFDKRTQILFLRLLEKMFIKKRQFNYDTCASFIKHLLLLCTKLTEQLPTLATILFIVKCMLNKYPKIQRMLDEENYGFGLDMYNEKIEDPQSTNAINTTIHEELKTIINKISNADIKNLTNRILNSEPLLTSVSSLKPMEFYQKLNQSAK